MATVHPPARPPAGDGIHYACIDCGLGVMLLAAHAGGVCDLAFADQRQALRQHLRQRYPQAGLLAAGRGLRELAWQIGQSLGKQPPSCRLALAGTPFQRRVWQAVAEVAPGSTASYQAIAERIGAPLAVRAVAMACAANPVAVLVPCHRIIASDGRLCGYRWGLWRKRALLDWEQAR